MNDNLPRPSFTEAEALAAILAQERTLFACRWLRIYDDGFAWLFDVPAMEPRYQLQVWYLGLWCKRQLFISLWQRRRGHRFQMTFHP